MRRKYFAEALGSQDNEIFKYADLLKKMFTTNSELKSPYLNDGLIFQPNEQKYIVESDKSKYSDYKWKPPTQNSLDLYVVFEKDKSSGKILISL